MMYYRTKFGYKGFSEAEDTVSAKCYDRTDLQTHWRHLGKLCQGHNFFKRKKDTECEANW